MKLASHPYQYYLLPSANPPPHLVTVHNRIHAFWKEMWTQVFTDLKADVGVLDEDFLRQDFIASICAGNEVISTHLYSMYAIDVHAARAHRYMAGNYPPEYFAKLATIGVRTVMSLEYLAVNPAWRKKAGKIHLGAVTAALGMKVLEHYGVDAAIAPARRDHKVHEMAYNLGGECIIPEVDVHHISCDLVAIRRVNSVCANPEVVALRDDLWANRIHAESTGTVEGQRVNRLKLAA